MRMSTCHPAKKHYAKGFCHSCYKRTFESATTRLNRLKAGREYHYKTHYKITAEQADLMRKAAKVCQICGKEEKYRHKILAIDHDHQTGKVRGCLCFNCNKFVGLIENRLTLLPRVFKYLKLRPDKVF